MNVKPMQRDLLLSVKKLLRTCSYREKKPNRKLICSSGRWAETDAGHQLERYSGACKIASAVHREPPCSYLQAEDYYGKKLQRHDHNGHYSLMAFAFVDAAATSTKTVTKNVTTGNL